MVSTNVCNGNTIRQGFDCHLTSSAVLLDLQIAQPLPDCVCFAAREVHYFSLLFDCRDKETTEPINGN